MQDGERTQVDTGAGMELQPADDGLDQFLPLRSGHRQGQRILEGRFVNGAEPVGLHRSKRIEIQIKSPLEREAEKCGVPIQKPKVEIGRTTLDGLQLQASSFRTASSRKAYSSPSRSECSRVR